MLAFERHSKVSQTQEPKTHGQVTQNALSITVVQCSQWCQQCIFDISITLSAFALYLSAILQSTNPSHTFNFHSINRNLLLLDTKYVEVVKNALKQFHQQESTVNSVKFSPNHVLAQ